VRIPWAVLPRPSWLRLPRLTARLRLTLLYSGLFFACGAVMLAITNILARTTGLFSVAEPPHCGIVAGQPRCVSTGQLFHAAGGRQLELTRAAAAHYSADLTHLLALSLITLGIMTLASFPLGWIVAGRVLRPVRTITVAARAISASSLHQRLALAGPDDEFRRLGDTLDELFARLQAAFDAQQAAVEAQRHFVANASHELRTPLALEQTLLELTLGDPQASVAEFRSICAELLALGVQQQRLIEALLTLASSERGLEQTEPFDLADLTAEAVHAAQPEMDRLGLRLTINFRPAPVIGDPDLAQRLLANLVDNAMRHNVPGGRIEITTGSDHAGSSLTVANTGPVVPPEEVSRLFEPFQRLSTARRHHRSGHGLGLSIVQAIANAHGAELTAHARPDGGLEVTVRFTAVPEQRAP
jgi:signal transduction histidine kinase